MSTNVNTNVNAMKLMAQDNIKLDNTKTQVQHRGGVIGCARCAPAHKLFGRSFNPITTMGGR